MSINTGFDLKDFQREVIGSYTSLRKSSDDNAKFSEQDYEGFETKPDLGVVRKILVKFTISFRAFFREIYVESEPYLELKGKAVEIIENPEIKKILCPIFKRRISEDFFKEELEIEVIIILTEALTEKEIAEKFSIEKDVTLFSMITYEILKRSIENYCLDK